MYMDYTNGPADEALQDEQDMVDLVEETLILN